MANITASTQMEGSLVIEDDSREFKQAMFMYLSSKRKLPPEVFHCWRVLTAKSNIVMVIAFHMFNLS